jgi:hypothetical protein
MELGDQAMTALMLDEPTLRAILISRIACAGETGATRAAVERDTSAIVSHIHTNGEWHARVAELVGGLQTQGVILSKTAKLRLSEEGHAAARSFLAVKSSKFPDWPEVRDMRLIARALGLQGESAKRQRALGNVERLRARILERVFALRLRGSATPARVRSALAVVALHRAFGNKLKNRLGAGKGLSGDAGRLLASQLLRRPREFDSDRRLLADLAAEQLGAPATDIAALRQAILRRFVTRRAPASERQPQQSENLRAELPAASGNTPRSVRSRRPERVEAHDARPDMMNFVAEVTRATTAGAQGWPGDRKAYISCVWKSIRDAQPNWQLSEIEFKCMLTEAHRSGRLVLANADLKSKTDQLKLRASAVSYKNTEWHYIRVQE